MSEQTLRKYDPIAVGGESTVVAEYEEIGRAHV